MERNKVLWFGSRGARNGAAEFEHRDLALEILNGATPSAEDLQAARGIVYCFGKNGVAAGRSFAEKSIRPAIDHGLAIMSVAGSDSILRHVQRELDGLGAPNVVIHRVEEPDPVPDHEIAQMMLMADPKLGWSGSLAIESIGKCDIPETDELLLRRAFSDCKLIRLSPLSGGRTAEAYMVEATVNGSRVGPRPLPFFAKLGQRDKISRERERYRDYAANFIPFHLRPNLDDARCLLGFDRGILVGNFVDRAIPLWSLAESGKAGRAIRALFDHTLGGWRAQGFEEPERRRGDAVAGELTQIFDYQRVRPEHLEMARLHGLSLDPRELWERLLERTWQHFYRAPMHGDLHPGNVFVRNCDAILIDLATVEQGPLSADPACLETSLAFERRERDEEKSTALWRECVERLYAPAAFRCRIAPFTGGDVFAHRFNSAREVRAVGLKQQACPTEYESAVAAYLLRRSIYRADDKLDAFRRAYALVVAERLILSVGGAST